MQLSKNALGNLINRYKAVLKKCHLLNTFGSLAIASALLVAVPHVPMSEAAAYTPTLDRPSTKEYLKTLTYDHDNDPTTPAVEAYTQAQIDAISSAYTVTDITDKAETASHYYTTFTTQEEQVDGAYKEITYGVMLKGHDYDSTKATHATLKGVVVDYITKQTSTAPNTAIGYYTEIDDVTPVNGSAPAEGSYTFSIKDPDDPSKTLYFAVLDNSGKVITTTKPIINGNTYTGNFIGNSDRAIFIVGGGNITINGDFIGNSATAHGGAIENHADNITINGDFIGNSATVKGGAIYTAGDRITINGDFIGNSATAHGGAIFNDDDISTINGDFIGNSVTAAHLAFGGAIFNEAETDGLFEFEGGGTIGSISGDFIGNSVTATNGTAYGGAIFSRGGIISNISGDFIGNSATAINGTAFGGVIGIQTPDLSHLGIIVKATFNNISGDFIGNSVTAAHQAFGGAINDGDISSISGDFIGNSATTTTAGGRATGGAINVGFIGSISGNFIGNSAIATVAAGLAQGGAIATSTDLTFTALDKTTNTFSGNFTKSGTAPKDFNAIFVFTNTIGKKTLNFNMEGDGDFVFNDNIRAGHPQGTPVNATYAINITGQNADKNIFSLNNTWYNAAEINIEHATLELGSVTHEGVLQEQSIYGAVRFKDNAKLTVKDGAWKVAKGTAFDTKNGSVTIKAGTVGDINSLDLSKADFTFTSGSIHLETRSALYADIDVFGTVDFTANDKFDAKSIGTLTSAADSTLYLTQDLDTFITLADINALSQEITEYFDAINGFDGTVDLGYAYTGVSDSLSSIIVSFNMPTFLVRAGNYGSANNFLNGTESTFAGIYGNEPSTVSKGTLNLTGNTNTEGRILSEAGITVETAGNERDAILNLGYDGAKSEATDGGTVQGDVILKDGLVNIYGKKGVSVTGDTIISGGTFTVNIDAAFKANDIIINGTSGIGGQFIIDSANVTAHTINQDSGSIQVYSDTIAYDAQTGLGIKELNVSENAGALAISGVTFNVGTANFAGDEIHFGYSAGTLSANTIHLNSSTGTRITGGSIESKEFTTDSELSLDGGNLTILSNETPADNKTNEWTATHDFTVTSGAFSVKSGAVVDLSAVDFNAVDGTLQSEQGSNIKVGLGTVGLNADGTDSGVNGTVVAAAVALGLSGVNVSDLLGTVTVMGLDKKTIDFANGGLNNTLYTTLDTHGQTSFGTTANIIYDNIFFANTESLNTDEVTNKSGFGNSVITFDANNNNISTGTLNVGAVLGGEGETLKKDHITFTGEILDENGNATYPEIIFAGNVIGTNGVDIGNAHSPTKGKIGGSVETQGGLSLINVEVGGNITQDGTGTAAFGTALLKNVSAKDVILNNSSGSIIEGDNEFTNLNANGGTVQQMGGTTTVSGTVTIADNVDYDITGGAVLKTDKFVVDVTSSAPPATIMNIGLSTDLVPSGLIANEVELKGYTLFSEPAWRDGVSITEQASYAYIGEFVNDNIDGTLIVGQNSFVVLGSTDKQWIMESFSDSGLSWGNGAGEIPSALFIRKAHALDATDGGILLDGSVTAGGGGNPEKSGAGITVDKNTVTFGADSLLVVDAGEDGVGMNNTEAALSADGNAILTIDSGAKLHIVDGTDGVLTVLSGFKDALTGELVDAWSLDNIILNSSVVQVAKIDKLNGSVKLTLSTGISNAGYTLFQEKTSGFLGKMIDNQFIDINSPHAGFKLLSLALSEGSGMGKLNEKRTVGTIEGAAQMGAVANVGGAIMGAANTVGNAIVNHNSAVGLGAVQGEGSGSVNINNGEITAEIGTNSGNMADKAGLGLWLTPLYQWKNGHGFEGGALEHDYDMGLGGIALGVDFTNRFDHETALRFGLAFNVGAGYSDSTGDFNETNNDFDFWGLSAYAAFQKQNFVATLDLGFTSSANELTQDLPASMGMGNLEADVDAFAFTAGLNLEYTFNSGNMEITPHAGVRFMSVTTAEYDIESASGLVATVEEDTQSVWYFPVGVTFSADMQSESGWTFTPKLDLGFIAAAGDLEATSKTRFTGVNDVLELNLENVDGFAFNGGLGFELSNEENGVSIGLNYNLTAGAKETGHMIFANFRYDF